MKLGILLKNSGPSASPDLIREGARIAEGEGLDSLWVNDHLAIPPDDAEGSGGHYLDPLATLAFAAGVTRKIGLGVGVLVLPYRPPLPTAKWVASIQELSQGRLLLGVGAGWMPAEFQALGVDRKRRGAITDQTLEFLHRCFGADLAESGGQDFLFLPRPERPPIFVGGAPDHAFRRILKWGEGWMPTGASPAKLGPKIAALHEQSRSAGRPVPETITFASLDLEDLGATRAQLDELSSIGVTRVVHGHRAQSLPEYRTAARALSELT